MSETPEGFFNSVLDLTFLSLQNAHEVVTLDISLAGLKVRLQFAGKALQPVILPAIKHLLFSELQASIDYTIYIWDSFSTHTAFPNAPTPKEDITLRGDIEGFNNDQFQGCYFGHAKMLNVLDQGSKTGIVCFRTYLDIPSFEITCPLRAVFSWILNHNERILIHAAAVGISNNAVLIGGQSGSGKSSTAIQCLLSGINYLGDDLCAVSCINTIPKVYSVYCSGKSVRHGHIQFAELNKMRLVKEDADYDKVLYFFSDHFKNQLPWEHELKAIVLPKQGSLEAGVEEIAKAAVLSIITSSTIQMLPNAGKNILYRLKSIVHQIPCYQLNLGSDIKEIPVAIEKLIASNSHQ